MIIWISKEFLEITEHGLKRKLSLYVGVPEEVISIYADHMEELKIIEEVVKSSLHNVSCLQY